MYNVQKIFLNRVIAMQPIEKSEGYSRMLPSESAALASLALYFSAYLNDWCHFHEHVLN
jgi:hypothetical protein